MRVHKDEKFKVWHVAPVTKYRKEQTKPQECRSHDINPEPCAIDPAFWRETDIQKILQHFFQLLTSDRGLLTYSVKLCHLV